MQVIVSKHARQRLAQRFRLLFHSSYFLNEQMTDSLIIRMAENGIKSHWWSDCPFYINKIKMTYGDIAVIKCIHSIYLIAQKRDRDTILIKTVVGNFDPRKIKLK